MITCGCWNKHKWSLAFILSTISVCISFRAAVEKAYPLGSTRNCSVFDYPEPCTAWADFQAAESTDGFNWFVFIGANVMLLAAIACLWSAIKLRRLHAVEPAFA